MGYTEINNTFPDLNDHILLSLEFQIKYIMPWFETLLIIRTEFLIEPWSKMLQGDPGDAQINDVERSAK